MKAEIYLDEPKVGIRRMIVLDDKDEDVILWFDYDPEEGFSLSGIKVLNNDEAWYGAHCLNEHMIPADLQEIKIVTPKNLEAFFKLHEIELV